MATGTAELIPSSELAAIDPAAHRAAMAKYDDTAQRRRLRDSPIPGIGRRWTEVVFLSPVHPHAVWTAWRELTGQRLPPMSFWSIPVWTLPAGTVRYERRRTAVGEPLDPADIEPLRPAEFATQHETTAANRDWLGQLAAAGRRGGWFNGLPHLLVPGRVSLAEARRLSWDDPIESESG